MNWSCSLVPLQFQAQGYQGSLGEKERKMQNMSFTGSISRNRNDSKKIESGYAYLLSKGLNKKKTSLRQGCSKNKKNLSHNEHQIVQQWKKNNGANLGSPQNYLSSVRSCAKIQPVLQGKSENYASSAAYKFHSPEPINLPSGNPISTRTKINFQSRQITSKTPFVSYKSHSNTQNSQIGKLFYQISSPDNFKKGPVIHQIQKINQPFHCLSQPILSFSSTKKDDGKQNRIPMNPKTRQFSIQEETEENNEKNDPKLKMKRKIEDFLKSKELVTSVKDSDSSSSDKSEYLGRISFMV